MTEEHTDTDRHNITEDCNLVLIDNHGRALSFIVDNVVEAGQDDDGRRRYVVGMDDIAKTIITPIIHVMKKAQVEESDMFNRVFGIK